MYFFLLTVAILVNYTSEFRELFEATKYFKSVYHKYDALKQCNDFMQHVTAEILQVLVFLQTITAGCNYISQKQERIFEALSDGYASYLWIQTLYSRISIKRLPPQTNTRGKAQQ